MGSYCGKREVRERLVLGNRVGFQEAAVRDRQLSLQRSHRPVHLSGLVVKPRGSGLAKTHQMTIK